MTDFTDVSIDIETGGTCAGYAVVNIGATYFNRKDGTFGKTLDVSLDVDDLKAKGYKLDARTMTWWDTQPDGVREHCWAGIVPVRDALYRLTEFLTDARLCKMRVWVKGEHMDIAMLEFMYDQESMPVPWHYRSPRDLRTYEDAVRDAGLDPQEVWPKSNTAAHTGLADALQQAQYIVGMYGLLSHKTSKVTRV